MYIKVLAYLKNAWILFCTLLTINFSSQQLVSPHILVHFFLFIPPFIRAILSKKILLKVGSWKKNIMEMMAKSYANYVQFLVKLMQFRFKCGEEKLGWNVKNSTHFVQDYLKIFLVAFACLKAHENSQMFHFLVGKDDWLFGTISNLLCNSFNPHFFTQMNNSERQ